MSSRLTPLIAALVLGTFGACAHQPPPGETVKALPHSTARTETVRTLPTDSDVTNREASAGVGGQPAIYFSLDSAQLSDDDRGVLQNVAGTFRQQHTAKVRIEGNCDDLGTTEYNLALGEHRALAAKEYLVHLGVPDGRIATISYGSSRPKYPEDDSGRPKNRRDDVIVR